VEYGLPDTIAQRRRLSISVVWGDISQVETDVCAVGHYIGVVPQRAELAIDRAVSGLNEPGRKLIITEMTKRGALRGELGEISFFPLGDTRLAAIVGMGRPGSFNRSRLEILTRTLVGCVGLMPRHQTLSTVLIGSGEGNNLQVRDCIETLLRATVDVVKGDESLLLTRFQIVELKLDRALEILDHVKAVARRYWPDKSSDDLLIDVESTFTTAPGRQIDTPFGYSMMLAALADFAGSGDAMKSPLVDQVLAALPDESNVKANVRKALEEARHAFEGTDTADRLQALARQFRIRLGDEASSHEVAERVAFWAEQDRIRATAITNTVTVTERELRKRLGLVQAAIERLQDANADQKERCAIDLYRLLVPRDLREVLDGNGPLVLELDPNLAPVQWELLQGEFGLKPLGVARPVARQLRTLYSPRPTETGGRHKLRALVVGDPGDERRGHGLRDARDEAAAVWAMLKANAAVDIAHSRLLVGPPADGSGAGTFMLDGSRVEPADYFEVVQLLLSGEFDIVHYCGHARFDADNPSEAGWIFKAGVLTAADLDGVIRAPTLVVANACLSARSGQSRNEDDATETRRRGDPRLVAALADEFFHCGVADYIGTAWEVSSTPAKMFADSFYRELLRGASIGDSVRRAREALYRNPDATKTWGAYQHYGDPTRTLP
jgi:CHAT domain-containing protein